MFQPQTQAFRPSPQTAEQPVERLSKPYKMPSPSEWLAEIVGADEAAKLIADHKVKGRAGIVARRRVG